MTIAMLMANTVTAAFRSDPTIQREQHRFGHAFQWSSKRFRYLQQPTCRHNREVDRVGLPSHITSYDLLDVPDGLDLAVFSIAR